MWGGSWEVGGGRVVPKGWSMGPLRGLPGLHRGCGRVWGLGWGLVCILAHISQPHGRGGKSPPLEEGLRTRGVACERVCQGRDIGSHSHLSLELRYSKDWI